MTTATVNPGGTDVWVLVKCYTGDGAFTYAAYFPVDANKNAAEKARRVRRAFSFTHFSVVSGAFISCVFDSRTFPMLAE